MTPSYTTADPDEAFDAFSRAVLDHSDNPTDETRIALVRAQQAYVWAAYLERAAARAGAKAREYQARIGVILG